MKLIAVALAAAMLAVPQASAKPGPPQRLLGVVWNQSSTALVKLDALTLRTLSKPLPAGRAASLVARSPGGGGRLAFAVDNDGGTLRFLDLRRMRWEGSIAASGLGFIRAAVWERAHRLVLLSAWAGTTIMVVDPTTRRVRSRRSLDGSLSGHFATRDRLVVLLAPEGAIGPARLVVVDGLGQMRSVALPGIRAGSRMISTDPYRAEYLRPGLAVDPLGRRAVVVPPTGPLAEVNLETLEATSHALADRTLAVARKEAIGSSRIASWFATDSIAVTGEDASLEGDLQRFTPAGLSLIDTRNWSIRRIDSETTNVASTSATLLAFGGTWDAVTRRSIGYGLTGYAGDGSRRFHLFGNDYVGVLFLAGTYAYLGSDDSGAIRIVDTLQGVIKNTVRPRATTTIATPIG
jgi:hypothetical protein